MRNYNLEYLDFESLSDPDGKRHLYVCDMSIDLSRWSKSGVEYFGLPGEYMEHAGDIWMEHVHPSDRQRYKDDIEKVFSGEKDYHFLDYRVKNAAGEYVVCTCKGTVLDAPQGDGKIFVGTIENHTMLDRIDSITGLYNEHTFLQNKVDYLEAKENYHFLIIGITKFTDVNRTFGYNLANKLLLCFANDLMSLEVCTEALYRLDGAKFCFVFSEIYADKVKDTYEEIKEMAHQGYDLEGVHFSFDIAGGFVTTKDVRDMGCSLTMAMATALNQSKHKRHGELVHIQKNILEAGILEISTLEAIRSCVFNQMDGFYLCYQPIVNVDNGLVVGMEALLRWEKEPYGSVPPGVFIPLLEKDPCFFELGNWIIRSALADAKSIVMENPDFMVNVNVSAEQIERTGFRTAVYNIINELGFPPQNLCLELTERVVSLDTAFLREELSFFRSLGIKIALDDFGTGVSSLNLLLELPVDIIKIDRNFVKDILTNKSQQIIVKSILSCADGMGLEVCVEGIETLEMIRFLEGYNIDKYQGYYYSKPIIFSKFQEYLYQKE